MSPETVAAIQQALVPVAEKIGQGAAYGWEVVVRQQFVEGVVGLAALGIGIMTLIIAAILAVHVPWNKSESEISPGEMVMGFTAMGLGFIGFMTFMFAFVNLFAGDVIGKLLNPEYYALEFFITLGKSAVGG